MHNFNFQNTTAIRFGQDVVQAGLYDSIRQFGERVLLVYGGGSIKKNGLYEQIQNLLKDMTIFELSGIQANPKIGSIIEGQQLAQKNKVDVILAVGGGSVIDAAKLIASAYYYDGEPWDLVVNSSKRKRIAQLPVVDIVTLAATGSEMNANSVISNPETKQKLGTAGPDTPAVSFLDPTWTFSVSKWQTAAGAIDIFSHLAEQYFDRAQTAVSDNMIEGLMRVVIENGPIALHNPKDYEARGNLMWASTLALNGLLRLGNENTWSVHQIEHELSAYYDVTHGIGLGILTPRWMAKVLQDSTTIPKFAKFGRNVWHINNEDDTIVAKQSVKYFYDWVAHLGVPMTLPELGIKDNDNFEKMATSAVKLKQLDQKAYFKLSISDVVTLYENSMIQMTF